MLIHFRGHARFLQTRRLFHDNFVERVHINDLNDLFESSPGHHQMFWQWPAFKRNESARTVG